MEAVDHFEMTAEILLSEMFQHACINQTLHERAAVLRQTQTWQPFIADPLMTHLTVRQALCTHTTQHNATYLTNIRLSEPPQTSNSLS